MFEIPVKDIDRSIKFYQSVFEVEIKKVRLMESVSAVIYESSSSLTGMLTSANSVRAAKAIVIQVSSEEVMNKYLRNAIKAGALSRTDGPDTKNIHVSAFEDPDGNVINFLVGRTA